MRKLQRLQAMKMIWVFLRNLIHTKAQRKNDSFNLFYIILQIFFRHTKALFTSPNPIVILIVPSRSSLLDSESNHQPEASTSILLRYINN